MSFEKPVICPVLVGRAPMLDALSGAIGHLSSGRGQTVLVSGEAGIGKSRLVAEVSARADPATFVLLQGACFETDRALPYAPLLDLLRRFVVGNSPETRASALGPHAADMVRLLPELAGLTVGRAPTPLEPEAEQRRFFRALGAFVDDMASTRSAVVVVEDVHWSDDPSLDFLLQLARRTVTSPILLLVTYRSDEIGPALGRFLAALDRERLAIETRLASLSRGEVEAMLRAIFDLQRPVDSEFVETISTLTEGNPFFVEEVVKSLVASGDLDYADVVRHRVPLGTVDVPRSVHEAVHRRSRRLGPSARRALEVAAVAGRRFDAAVVADLLGCDDGQLLALIKELVAAQLVVEESADRYAFRHALTRQAVYRGLLARERRALHREVAEAILRQTGDGTDEVAGDLSRHFFEAGLWAQAQRYAERAGELAVARYAPRAAVEHFTRALEAADRGAVSSSPAVRRARGLVYATLGDFNAARADFEAIQAQAVALGDRRGEWQSALDLGQLWSSRDFDEAGAEFRRAADYAREIGDPAMLAASLNWLGNWHMNGDEPHESLRYHREALGINQGIGDGAGIAETLTFLGFAHCFAGDLVESAAAFRRAVALWRELGNRAELAHALASLTLCGPSVPSDTLVPADVPFAETDRGNEEALQIAREIDWPAGAIFVGLLRLASFGSQGAFGRALESARELIDASTSIAHQEWICGVHAEAGIVYFNLLACDEARRLLEVGVATAREVRSRHWLNYASGRLASLAVFQGDLSTAQVVLDAVLDTDTPAVTAGQRCCWLARAELALARRLPDEALKIVDRLIASAPNAAPDHIVPRFAILRGEILVAIGRLIEAEAEFRAAVAVTAVHGTRPLNWRANAALGRLLRSQRRTAEAEASLTSARATIADLAATVPDRALRENFQRIATASLPPVRPPTPLRAAKGAAGGLTAREREVAVLVARGLTNRRIAEALSISEETAAVHVKHILAKLDVASRAEVAAWTVRQDFFAEVDRSPSV